MLNCAVCGKGMDRVFVVVTVSLYKILSTTYVEDKAHHLCNREEHEMPPVCNMTCLIKFYRQEAKNMAKRLKEALAAEAAEKATEKAKPTAKSADPNGC